MGRASPLSFSAKRRLAMPLKMAWTFFYDTDRINRAVGLPPIAFVPSPDPQKKGHYTATIKLFGFGLNYEEFPFDWVEQRYYRVMRRFPSGPIQQIVGGMRFLEAEQGTELDVFAEVTPRTWLGRLLSKTLFKKKTIQELLNLSELFERHFLKAENCPLPTLPQENQFNKKQFYSRLDSLKASFDKTLLIQKLERSLTVDSDLEVTRLRPFDLADRWGEDRIDVLKLMLHAAKSGLVDLKWDVLCPQCHADVEKQTELAQLKEEAHCGTCAIHFKVDLVNSVEVTFSVNPGVRIARRDVYCIGGPANTPRIMAQLRLEPHERREEIFFLSPGPLLVRCYQVPGLARVSVKEDRMGHGKKVEIFCQEAGIQIENQPFLSGSMTLNITNQLDREALVVIERESWMDSAATAALVTTLQDFKDIFPQTAVAPGSEIQMGRLVVLFTDLQGSTHLYEKIGDSSAFDFVQSHFQYLTEIVSKHRGGLVKTMGDAIMASFFNARDAMEAALAMQQGWKAFLNRHPLQTKVALKIGVHQGSTIAINNKGKLDYFGASINMAARVESQSLGGDVVFSEAIRNDPDTQEVLALNHYRCDVFNAELKGIHGSQQLYRLWPIAV